MASSVIVFPLLAFADLARVVAMERA